MKRRIRELRKKIREFEAYDRVYYDGKLSTLFLIFICFILIMVIIGVIALWMI